MPIDHMPRFFSFGIPRAVRSRAADGASGRADFVYLLRPVAGLVSLPDERLAPAPDLVRLGVIARVQDVTDSLFQVIFRHGDVMLVLYEAEFSQRDGDGVVRKQERAGGGDFKVLGDHVAIYKAVGESRAAGVDAFGVGAPDAFVYVVVVPAVIAGVRLIVYRVRAALVQPLHLQAQRVVGGHGPTEEDAVRRRRVIAEQEIRRGRVWNPHDLLRAAELRVELVPEVSIRGENRVAEGEADRARAPHRLVPPVQVVGQNKFTTVEPIDLFREGAQTILAPPEQNALRHTTELGHERPLDCPRPVP